MSFPDDIPLPVTVGDHIQAKILQELRRISGLLEDREYIPRTPVEVPPETIRVKERRKRSD